MLFTPMHKIDDRTQLVGRIGQTRGGWSSPTIYNVAFDALGLNWRCVPLRVPKGQLRAALSGLRALGFVGAEVSEPHQRQVVDYLEELSPAAEIIGAVNFVRVNQRGWLVGDNTRWNSFLGALCTMASSLNGLRPLVIGSGERAQDTIYALAREGLPITIVSQRIDEAINVVRRLRHVLDEHSFSVYRWPHDLAWVVSDVNLIINATKVPTWPDANRSPWPEDLPFPPDAMAFDLTFWPSETRFLRQARAGGAKTVDGLSLRVYEAALALERWTGRTPPLEAIFQAAQQMLSTHVPQDPPQPEKVAAST